MWGQLEDCSRKAPVSAYSYRIGNSHALAKYRDRNRSGGGLWLAGTTVGSRVRLAPKWWSWWSWWTLDLTSARSEARSSLTC